MCWAGVIPFFQLGDFSLIEDLARHDFEQK